MNNVNLNAVEVYQRRKAKFAIQGLLIGLFSGALFGFTGHLVAFVNAQPALAIGSTIGAVFALSLATQGIYDTVASIYMFIRNSIRGQGIKEYVRVIKAAKLAKLLLLAAICGGPLATVAFIVGLNLCGVTYAMVIASMSPIVTAILGRILYKERLGIRAIFGISIAIAGAIIVSWSTPDPTAYPHFTLGLLISLLACLGWGLEAAVAAYAGDMTDPNMIVGIFRTFCSGIFSLVVLIPIIGYITSTGLLGYQLVRVMFTDSTILSFMLVIGIITANTYLTTYTAFCKTGGTRGIVMVNSYTLWSIVFGLLLTAVGFTTYTVTGQVITGAIICTIGIVLVAGNPKDMIKLRDV